MMNRSRHYALALVAMTAANALLVQPATAQCRDPWISQAIREVTGRGPNGSGETGECRYTQYGGGRWGSYAELKSYVQAVLGTSYRGALSGQFQGPAAQVRGGRIVVPANQATQMRTINGRQQFQFQGRWYNLIGTDGASLIGTDGGS